MKTTNINNKEHKNIMIIDDDLDITNLFKVFLESNGYKVDAFTDPLKALTEFKRNSIDLVILDLKMPNVNGITLYRKIKEIDDNVIICLTTADITLTNDLKKGIIENEKFVLYKPILLKELKNKIESLLQI